MENFIGHINPAAMYHRADVKHLVGIQAIPACDFPIRGSALIQHLLRCQPYAGSPEAPSVSRVRKIQLRLSLAEHHFLSTIGHCYSLKPAVLIRKCCLRQKLPPAQSALSLSMLHLLHSLEEYEELFDLCVQIKEFLSMKSPINLPVSTFQKNHSRITIRFSEAEWARIGPKGMFSTYAWQSIRRYRWTKHVSLQPDLYLELFSQFCSRIDRHCWLADIQKTLQTIVSIMKTQL